MKLKSSSAANWRWLIWGNPSKELETDRLETIEPVIKGSHNDAACSFKASDSVGSASKFSSENVSCHLRKTIRLANIFKRTFELKGMFDRCFWEKSETLLLNVLDLHKNDQIFAHCWRKNLLKTKRARRMMFVGHFHSIGFSNIVCWIKKILFTDLP